MLPQTPTNNSLAAIPHQMKSCSYACLNTSAFTENRKQAQRRHQWQQLQDSAHGDLSLYPVFPRREVPRRLYTRASRSALGNIRRAEIAQTVATVPASFASLEECKPVLNHYHSSVFARHWPLSSTMTKEVQLKKPAPSPQVPLPVSLIASVKARPKSTVKVRLAASGFIRKQQLAQVYLASKAPLKRHSKQEYK